VSVRWESLYFFGAILGGIFENGFGASFYDTEPVLVFL